MKRRARMVAGRIYRAASNPRGRRMLATMLADGLPRTLELPLGFLFGTRPPPRSLEVAAVVEDARAQIARSSDRFRFEHVAGARGVRWPVRDDHGAIAASDLATSVSVDARWGMFLHLCAEGTDPETIVEIGACVGISGSYLASARGYPRLVT